MSVSLVDDFQAAVAEASRRDEGTQLLPTVLARACTTVLPIAGAGISMTGHLRVPLGSSDDTAAAAERLQTTLGEGPCLTASASDEPLAADLDEMTARWPMFTAKLIEQTPYRFLVSLPLLSDEPPRHRLGALDLYLTGEAPQLPRLEVMVEEIAEPIATTLFSSPPYVERSGVTLPTWTTGTAATNRMNVWVAVGMLLGHAHLNSSEALATLRGYAYTHDTTLDDLADQLMQNRLAPETVLAGPDDPTSH